jgi:hypothetical protein
MATPKLKVIQTKKGTLRSSDFTLLTSQSHPTDKQDKTEGDDS